MDKIVKIPKRASFENEEDNGCVIERMCLVHDYFGKVWLMSNVFATSLLFTLSYRNTYTHTPCSHHAASRLKKISPLHSYCVLAPNYEEFYLMTPIVWNKSGIFKNAVVTFVLSSAIYWPSYAVNMNKNSNNITFRCCLQVALYCTSRGISKWKSLHTKLWDPKHIQNIA